ncbi:LysR family transcriptional regulator [Litoreibacter roseus]|uniref:Fhu operon transcription regulator n=1 Tax=Litoreibacter roseus TaxID=2601869 RepID=A0A6N6JKL0_9RHOB|nr:LysR family transcriptional regulator [Litoreibacter roseus]GFE66575.1 fhu operon transcription regulator [Litoreibacter roseus]
MNDVAAYRSTQPQLSDLRSFIAVAEAGSFRAAATMRGLQQSTFSRRVRQLEDIIGVSLFERRSDGVRLTRAGENFLRRAQAALRDLDRAVMLATRDGAARTGVLVIGIIDSMSTGHQRDFLQVIAAAMPDIEISILEDTRSALIAGLYRGSIDAAILYGDAGTDDLDVLPMWSEQVVAALPFDDGLEAADSIRTDDLASTKIILMARDPGPDIQAYLSELIAKPPKRSRVVLHDVGREALLNMVGLDMGVTLGLRSWTGTAYPGVRFAKIENAPKMGFSLVWSPTRDNPVLRRTISLARNLVRAD